MSQTQKAQKLTSHIYLWSCKTILYQFIVGIVFLQTSDQNATLRAQRCRTLSSFRDPWSTIPLVTSNDRGWPRRSALHCQFWPQFLAIGIQPVLDPFTLTAATAPSEATLVIRT